LIFVFFIKYVEGEIMKNKKFFSLLAASGLSSLPVPSYAQDLNEDSFAPASPTVAVHPASSGTSVTSSGRIKNYLGFEDSTNKLILPQKNIKALYDVKAAEGTARGELELEAMMDTVDNQGGPVSVRVARVGLSNDVSSVYAGRFIPLTPVFYSSAFSRTNFEDYTFGSVDGLQLGYAGWTTANNFSLTAELYVANALGQPTSPTTVYFLGAVDNGFKIVPDPTSRALGGYLGLDIKKIGLVAEAAYTAQNNAILINNILADVSRLVVSAGYVGLMGLKAGGFYHLDSISTGSLFAVTNNDTVINSTAAKLPSYTVTHWGIGANGDSSLFHVSSFWQADDRILWGVGYEVHNMVRTTGVTGESSNDQDEIAVNVGYGLHGLKANVGYTLITTANQTFSDRNGTGIVDSKETIGLLAQYDF